MTIVLKNRLQPVLCGYTYIDECHETVKTFSKTCFIKNKGLHSFISKVIKPRTHSKIFIRPKHITFDGGM